jgi:late competence protein required for DNA uptake (superfamily II DNA/RNA helicase)
MPQVLKDPFTPPAAYEALVAILAKGKLVACCRCGTISRRPKRKTSKGKTNVSVCRCCGAIGRRDAEDGVTRPLKPAKWSAVRNLPALAHLRRGHDRVVAKLWG